MKFIGNSTFLAGLAIGILLLGCASNPVNIAKMPPDRYEVIGRAKGSACGMLGLVHPNIQFFPFALNSRVARAYNRAIESVPGADSLINVQLDEDWYWWILGTARCVTVSGDAVRGLS